MQSFMLYYPQANCTCSLSLSHGCTLPRLTLTTTAIPTTVSVEEERPPPPLPTPLTFPEYGSYIRSGAEPSSGVRCRHRRESLYTLLSRVRKPQDASLAYLDSLNVTVKPDIPLRELIPGVDLGELPPYRWEEIEKQNQERAAAAQQTEGQQQTTVQRWRLLPNGFPAPDRTKLDNIRAEAGYNNDDAIRTIARLPLTPGRERIRIAHSRKFFMGLDRMRQYWDSDSDNYYETEIEVSTPNADGNRSASESADMMDVDSPAASERQTVRKYKGQRIGTGATMPEDIREETVRGFLEMAAWPFGCNLAVPSLPPRLEVKNLLFPIRASFHVGRPPTDRSLARRGMLEGPIIGVQCRGETGFGACIDTSDDCGEGDDFVDAQKAAIADLWREVAGCLVLAQERARDGTSEIRPGEGKWWTTRARWGGAPNGGPEEAEAERDMSNGDKAGKPTSRQSETTPSETERGNTEKDQPEKAKACGDTKRVRLGPTRRSGSSSSSKRRETPADRWRQLAPGPSRWDRRLLYRRISGSTPDSAWDDVSFLSLSWSFLWIWIVSLDSGFNTGTRLMSLLADHFAFFYQSPSCHPAPARSSRLPNLA